MSSDHQCLSEDTVLTLVSGGFEEARACALLREAEQCTDCSLLLEEAGRAIADGATEESEASPLLNSEGALQIGDIVAARFRVLRLLGCGGMGEVYEALDSELGELVALKTIRTGHASLASSIDRFKREVRLARRVVHANVCRVLEFGRHQADSGVPVYFLTMELLRGEPLSRHLRRQVRLNALESVAIVRQIADGLSAIHARGVLHRDIKPSNVMLCNNPAQEEPPGRAAARAVLLDFGVARSLAPGSATSSHAALIGTPDYMAPEQLRSQALSPATDIYALGMVLFELLTGQLPLAAAPTLTRALERHQGSGPAASSSAVELPPALERLVARCLEVDPARRPQSAEELLKELLALERALSQPSISSLAPSAQTGAGSTRSTRARLMAACAIALGLGTVLAVRARAVRSRAAVVSASSQAASRQASPPASVHVDLPVLSAGGAASLPSEPRVNQATPPGGPGPSKAPAAQAQRASIGSGARSPAPAERPCSPPYYFDPDGFRVYRKECL